MLSPHVTNLRETAAFNKRPSSIRNKEPRDIILKTDSREASDVYTDLKHFLPITIGRTTMHLLKLNTHRKSVSFIRQATNPTGFYLEVIRFFASRFVQWRLPWRIACLLETTSTPCFLLICISQDSYWITIYYHRKRPTYKKKLLT